MTRQTTHARGTKARRHTESDAQGRTLRLRIDLLPLAVWGHSLAKTLSPSIWGALRHRALLAFGGRCVLCETMPAAHVHEGWRYDLPGRGATVDTLFPVCRDCHAVIHWGRTQKVAAPEEQTRLVEHFCAVNHCTRQTFEDHLCEAAVDFDDLNALGLRVVPPIAIHIGNEVVSVRSRGH
jgi:hypothetical protein